MADSVVLPPQQHKQPSRKGKKAWRKNVDLTEVQTGLDIVRDEIIKGGVVAEIPSEQLFITDVKPSAEVQKAYRKSHKVLKADEILAQRSVIPSVQSRKRSADAKTTSGLVEPGAKRRRGEYVPHKKYEELRKMAYGGDAVKKDVVDSTIDADYDPWNVVEVVKKPERSFLEEKKATREPETLKHAPISMAKNGKPIAAVSRPRAGKSYNPVFEDWQNLIEREGGKAVEEEMIRLEEVRKDEERQVLIARAQAEEEQEKWESEWESEWEGIMSEREEEHSSAWLKKKRPERKTPAERNKVNKRKAEEAKRIHEEKMRTRDTDFSKLKALEKAARKQRAQKEQALAAAAEESQDSSSDEDIQLRRRRIGKAAIPAAPLEVVLVDELQDSLRRLRPEGNLLKDRYRNMILNGKIESRSKITQPKLAKKKATEKWSYKDWKLT